MKTKAPNILFEGFLGLIFILVLSSATAFAQRSQTVSPHGDLVIDLSCEDCHTAEAWIPAKDTMNFNHNSQTGFDLIGKHSIVECQSCHFDLDFTEPNIIGEGCETCHIDVHQGAFIQSCTDCHNQESFTDVDGMFIHSQTAFPLTGAHQQIECESCHEDQSNGHFTTLDTDCYSCHAEEYTSAETIDHEASGFPITCEDCHTTFAWQTAFFEHEIASGGFALLGAHGNINCGACHEIPSLEPLFDATSDQDCFGCHMDDYNHEHGGSGFPTDCQACHNLNSWGDAEFEHAAVSGGFELLGEHDELDCDNCHTGNGGGLLFDPAPTSDEDCYSCHVDDYNKEHAGSGFPTDCLECHNVNDWDDAEFDHITVSSGFELLGAHDELNCRSCHTEDGGLVFTAHPTNDQDCYSCHVEDYNEEHPGTGFSTDCRECHNVNNWEGAEFNHVDASGGFELLGAHIEINCQSCHTEDGGLLFDPAPANDEDCYSCHIDEYNQEHAGSGFSTDCQDCHNVNTWEGSEFDHVEESGGFELIGAHGQLACLSCHTESGELIFSPPPASDQDCYSCHAEDYNREHTGTGFPTDCLECHNNNVWEDAEFDHLEVSGGFELTGAHNQISCEDCHTGDGGLIFNPPPDNDEDCYSCHVDDYNREHSGTGFPTDCQDCHNVNDWDDADFEHAEVSGGFELIGAHGQLDCESCHTDDGGLIFSPPPDNDGDCYSCHADDYNREHSGTGFPTDCQDCHNVNDWEDADFEHADVSGGFDLIGAHGQLDCESCHTDDGGLIFSPPPDNDEDCYSCHSDDYNREHSGSGFPTDCQDCHNNNDWEDADFEHADVSGGFDLIGAHGHLDCESCHTDDGGLIFSPPPDNDEDCYSCHADDYNREHSGSGFPTDCQDCHNNNDWEDADFEHEDVSGGFELLGAHGSLDCESCHTDDGGLIFSPSPDNDEDCYSCHADDYNREHSGSGFPTDCLGCHNVNDWEDADFEDHDNLYFPIFSGNHRNVWDGDCKTCHFVSDDFSQFTCIDCHEHNEPETNDDHDEVSGYIYDSSACYSCHPSGREEEGDDD